MPRRDAIFSRCLVVAAAVSLAAGALPARALPVLPAGLQQLAQSGPRNLAPAQMEDVGGFSGDQLQAYANAVMKIQTLDREWQPRIDQAENEAEAEVLAAQATQEMIGEIEAEGLSLGEYNAITRAAEQDRQLYDHIVTLLAQAR